MKNKPIKVIRNYRGNMSDMPSDRGFSRADCQWYSKVPKDLEGNIKFRQMIIREAANNPDLQLELWKACKREPLFWVNTFCYTYDPRLPVGLQVIPFITFDVQDEVIYEMFQALGYYDLLVEKSRDEGLSWISMTVMSHEFQFEQDQQFSVTSRKSDLVDKTGNKDSLFWKIEFLLKKQPGWLRPYYLHNEMMLMHPEMDSTIIGESATGDVGRGGRNRAMFLDEFSTFARDDGYKVEAATASNTNCRIFNGTPRGSGNAFFDVREGLVNKSRAGKLLRVHWSEDPRKNYGLYTSGAGYREFYPGAPDHDRYNDDDIVMLERTPFGREVDEFDFPSDYQYFVDGKIRSPWYDTEAKRYAHPMLLAQELDIDYHNSSFRFFDEAVLQRIIDDQTIDPIAVGDFKFLDDGEFDGFEDDDEGCWRIWVTLDAHKRPPRHMKFVIGADISSGTGASNSCFSIVDAETCTKVASYVNPRITPEDLGRYGAHICKLFNDAYFIWENNGPGRPFSKKLLEGGVTNFYHRKDDVSIKQKVSDIPGWASTNERKYTLFSEYRDAQHKGTFTNLCSISVKECREYENMPGNIVVHQAAKNSIDPSGAKTGHGDRVMADALANKGFFEINRGKLRNSDNSNNENANSAPPGTFGNRFQNAMQKENTTDRWDQPGKVW